MSDLTNYASGLTAYNKDGLELFIHKDGNVYASKRAMARMLETPLTTVDKALKVITFLAPLHAQVHTGGGLKDVHLHGVETLVTLAQKYNPELAKRFALMGASVYLYQLAGYKVGIVNEPAKALEGRELYVAYLEQSKKMNEVLEAHIKLIDDVALNAGTANKVMNHSDDDGNIYTIEELLEIRGLAVPELKIKQNLSRRLKAAIQNDTLAYLGKKSKRYQNANGQTKFYQVTGYSRTSLAAFDNECKFYGLSS